MKDLEVKHNRWFLMSVILAASLLACAAPNFFQSDQGSGPDEPVATEQVGGGESGASSSSDESLGDDIPMIMGICPGSEESDDKAILTVTHDLTWDPGNGPKIDLDGSANYTLTYSPRIDSTKGEDRGSLAYQGASATNVVITITWPDCTPKPVALTTSYTPSISGECRSGQVEVTFTEKWKSAQIDIFCPPGTKLGGDDGATIPWYMPFAMGAAGSVSRTFTLTSDYSLEPPFHDVEFLGAGGSGKRILQLEWLP
jgi:hypothetical protein